MSIQKIPLARSLPVFTTQKAVDEIQRRGQALPGHVISVSGSIVTVAFDVEGESLPQVTIPLFGPEYIRYPVQVGDKGVAFPCSVYIGNVSGLGGTTPTTTNPGNLSALVWFPCGNANWSSAASNAVTVYGPNGVVLRDTNSDTVFTLTSSGLSVTAQTSISLTVGSHTLSISSTGITIDGRVFLAHEHTGVTTGTGTSGPPV